VSERQLLEARAAGADAVLLITEALPDSELQRLLQRATSLGLSALVEAHAAPEVRRALDAGAEIIGVNSRNLRTLVVSSDTPEHLIRLVPPKVVCVAESGIRSAADVARLRQAGYRAFLVGASLVVQRDPGAALRALMNGDSR
jgi:indole-3-glycerol phosphate synthase